jgi:hypothetical protein
MLTVVESTEQNGHGAVLAQTSREVAKKDLQKLPVPVVEPVLLRARAHQGNWQQQCNRNF